MSTLHITGPSNLVISYWILETVLWIIDYTFYLFSLSGHTVKALAHSATLREVLHAIVSVQFPYCAQFQLGAISAMPGRKISYLSVRGFPSGTRDKSRRARDRLIPPGTKFFPPGIKFFHPGTKFFPPAPLAFFGLLSS